MINYIEHVFKSFKLPDDEFEYIFYKMKRIYDVCFLQTFIRYTSDKDVYEYSDDAKIKIKTYEKIPVSYSEDGNFTTLNYKKNKIPYYMFSSSDTYDPEFVNKYTFRIHNNIYLNFETTTYTDKQHYNIVYINYNHDEKLEENRINDIIQSVKSNLESVYETNMEIFSNR